MVACHDFDSSATEDPPCRGGLRTLNLSRFKHPPTGLVWKLGERERVPVQVSSFSLDDSPHAASYFEHHAGASTFLARFHPNFEGDHPRDGQGASHLSSPSNHLTRRLAPRRLFRVPPCRKGATHLQASMPSPGFYGTVVSISNWLGDAMGL
ncbi:hypothetical protein TNCV_2804371 [Trichonephila clavipes]|nr:hypothetical protein TNCV_2804371 [Trichonephila clavipes]